MESVGKRLELLRGSVTRKDFAERLGIPANTLRNYELGISLPNSDLIAKICQDFGINPRWLILGEEPQLDADRSVERLQFVGKGKDLRGKSLPFSKVSYGTKMDVTTATLEGSLRNARESLKLIDTIHEFIDEAVAETGVDLTEMQRNAVIDIILEEMEQRTITVTKAIKGL